LAGTVTQVCSVGCQLRRDPAQVSRARRLVRETLAEWGLDDYIDHTMLISSELVTNALRHGAGMISIRLYRARHDLRIEVHDHGAGRPLRRHAGTGDESGRGLEVIAIGLKQMPFDQLDLPHANPLTSVELELPASPPRKSPDTFRCLQR